MLEQEPKPEVNLEEELRKRGWMIEKIDKEKEPWSQCQKSDCFEDADWFIEGGFYCPKHKDWMLNELKETQENIDIKRKERSEKSKKI